MKQKTQMQVRAEREILRGPDGATVTLDRNEIYPNDPGAGTPVLVEWRGHTGTWECVMDTGEIDAGDAAVPEPVLRWLETIRARVEKWENTAWKKATADEAADQPEEFRSARGEMADAHFAADCELEPEDDRD